MKMLTVLGFPCGGNGERGHQERLHHEQRRQSVGKQLMLEVNLLAQEADQFETCHLRRLFLGHRSLRKRRSYPCFLELDQPTLRNLS
jgi:hypothetical protein